MPKKNRLKLTVTLNKGDRRRQRARNALQQKERRMNMTEEEREAGREQQRERSRIRRKQMAPEEKAKEREKWTSYMRNKRRLAEKYGDQIYTGPDAVEGETINERRKRLNRERTRERRRKCPKTVEEKCKLALKKRVEHWVHRELRTQEELGLEATLKNPRNRGIEETPEEEDNRCFKPYLAMQLRIEWNDVYCELRDKAVFLEGLWDSLKPPPTGACVAPIPSASKSTRPPTYTPSGSASAIASTSTSTSKETEFGRIYYLEDMDFQTDKGEQAGWANLLSDTDNEDSNSDDDESNSNRNAIRDNFLQQRMEEGLEDNFDDESKYKKQPDESVDEWIARVNTLDAKMAYSSSSNAASTLTTKIKPRSRKSKLVARAKIKQSIDPDPDKRPRSPIRRPESRQPVSRGMDSGKLHTFKKYYSTKMREQKLEKFKQLCDEARKRWISERPDEDLLRASTDESRVQLKEKIYLEKTERATKIRTELDRKQLELEKETPEEHTERMKLSMESARKFLVLNDTAPAAHRPHAKKHLTPEELEKYELEQKQRRSERQKLRLKKLQQMEPETKAQRNAKQAQESRIRNRMHFAEHKIYQEFVDTGDPEMFYSLLVNEDNQKVVEYWYNYNAKSYKTPEEVILYRRKLYRMLTAKKSLSQMLADSATGVEISGQEKQKRASELVEKFQDLKNLVSTSGDKIKEFLDYKRYYGVNKARQYYSRDDIKEKLEERKERMKAYQRCLYHKKKYGVTLEPGSYVRPRDPNKPYGYRKLEEKARIAAGIETVTSRTQNHSSKPRTGKSKSTRGPRKTGSKKAPRYVYHQESSAEDSNTNSASNDGVTDDHHDQDEQDDGPDESEDGWMPLATFEIDSGLPTDLMHLPLGGNQNQSGNNSIQNQSSQPQQFPGTTQTSALFQQYQNQQSFARGQNLQPCPQYQQAPFAQNPDALTPLTIYANQAMSFHASQMQWNNQAPNQSLIQPVQRNEPLNYSLQFLPNSQVNLISQQQQFAHHQQSNSNQSPWQVEPGSDTSQSPHMPQLQDHSMSSPKRRPPPLRSMSPDITNIHTAPTSNQRKRGRPKKITINRFKNMPKLVIEIERMRNEIEVPPDEQEEVALPPPKPCFPSFKLAKEKIILSPFPAPVANISDLNLDKDKLLPKCSRCDKVCCNQRTLDKHVARHHKDEVPVVPAPDLENPNPGNPENSELTSTQIQSNSTEEPKPSEPQTRSWECKCCGGDYLRRPHLIRHIWTVHYEKHRNDYTCPFARKLDFRSCYNLKFGRSDLRKHLYSRHKGEMRGTFVYGLYSRGERHPMTNVTQFLCSMCNDQIYQTFESLLDHVSSTHSKQRYCCEFCGITLKMVGHYNDHIQIFHPEVNAKTHKSAEAIEIAETDIFRCNTCESEFLSESFLEQHKTKGHILMEGAEKRQSFSFRCAACDKEYSKKENRDTHYKECSVRNHSCYWCLAKLDSEETLKGHLMEKHPEKPPVPEGFTTENSHNLYKCELCKRSYMDLSSLRTHCASSHKLHEYFLKLKKDKESGILSVNPSSAIPTLPRNRDTSLVQIGEVTPSSTIEVEVTTTSTPKAPHTCRKCETSVSAEQFHIDHRTYSKLLRRHCKLCNRTFSRAIVLVTHNRTAHNITEEDDDTDILKYLTISHTKPAKVSRNSIPVPDHHGCSMCSEAFSSEEFHLHHSYFQVNPDIRYCKICNEKFLNPQSWMGHMRVFHPEVPKRITKNTVIEEEEERLATTVSTAPTRTITDQDFDSLSASTTLESAKGNVTIWTCKVCLKNFKTSDFLRQHIFKEHEKDAYTRLLCEICKPNKTFANNESLRRHKRAFHGKNNKRTQCPFCDNLYYRLEHLRAHVERKHDNLPFHPNQLKRVTMDMETTPSTENEFVCELCRKTFSSEDGLKFHRTNKHFPFHFSSFCEICGLQMAEPALKFHVQTFHPEDTEAVQKLAPAKLSLMDVIELLEEVNKRRSLSKGRDKETGDGKQGRKSKRRRAKTSKNLKRRKKDDILDNSEVEEGEDDSSDEDDDDWHTSSSSDDEDEEGLLQTSDTDNDYAGRKFVTPKSSNSQKNRVSLKEFIVRPDPKPKSRKSAPARPTKAKRKRDNYSSESEVEEESKSSEYDDPSASDSESDDYKMPKSRTRTRRKQQKVKPPNKKPPPSTKSKITLDKKLVIVLERCDSLVEGLKKELLQKKSTPTKITTIKPSNSKSHKRKTSVKKAPSRKTKAKAKSGNKKAKIPMKTSPETKYLANTPPRSQTPEDLNLSNFTSEDPYLVVVKEEPGYAFEDPDQLVGKQAGSVPIPEPDWQLIGLSPEEYGYDYVAPNADPLA